MLHDAETAWTPFLVYWTALTEKQSEDFCKLVALATSSDVPLKKALGRTLVPS